MKKVFFIITAYCFWGILTASAQDSKMTSDELNFRNGMEQFLKEEGYLPTIDSEDNSLNFKKEGEKYWIIIEGSSPTYVEIHKAGFGIKDTNHNYLIEACNKATRETRCAKAYVTKSSVSFTIEVYCHSVDDFRHIFYRSIGALDSAKDKTKTYYNELDK
jgi:hypothetical protein